MKDFTIDKSKFIMCGDSSPDLTIDMVEKSMAEIKTESELAILFAVVENKAWWIEDEEYDFDEGTDEYRQATEKTDLWFSLVDKLRNKIFDILHSEGVEIPETKQIVVLEPFMKRNGFRDRQGWWMKI